MRSLSAILVGFVLVFAAGAAHASKFVDHLLKRMTIEEKVGQLTQYSADMSVTGETTERDYEKEIRLGRVGSIFNVHTPAVTRRLQKLAVEQTRLKIPLLFGHDVIHGHRTIFPIPLGESATWDLARLESAAAVAAKEAAADGLHWTFAPMADVSRDPRWGRVAEGAGEDPWLGARIAVARVRGFQGNGGDENVLACVKHFAGYGAVQGGRDYNVVDMSERELFETYMPPYEAAVKAGAATVMTAFNEIAGVPSTSNRRLLTTILREKWGFKGFVVTDYSAIHELIAHGVAAGDEQAARLAFNAGVDMDMQDGAFAKHLEGLVRSHAISETALNAAVRRILEAKEKLGLFADPYRRSNEDRARAVLMSPENLAAARDVARRSFVLLKNDNSTLPLARKGTIAVIGPLGDDRRNMIGNWSSAGQGKEAVSLLSGLTAAAGPNTKILFAKGSNLLDDHKLAKLLNEHWGEITFDERSPEDMLKEAVDIAKKSDVLVVALGEAQGMTGEAASRTRLRLPKGQLALLQAMRGTGKPIVLVLFNGRPLVLEDEMDLADAALEAWFPGTQAGPALADVLFGDYNPAGKLTISFPYNEGQIPVHYGMKNTGRPYTPGTKYTSRYLDAPNDPMFPFGWGLSYTTFAYSDLRLSKSEIHRGEPLTVSVTLKNTGARDGEEVAQLYLHDLVATITRPTKQLRGFQKVFLKAGESRDLTFKVSYDDLKFYDKDMKWIAEPGDFDVMIGGNSIELKKATFRLVD